MDMPHSYWEDNSNLRVKYEGCSLSDENGRLKEDRFPCCDTNLNFSTATCSEDDSEFGPYKKSKVTRQDPMSHRIIEKRRRDRMNNCLADLSRLIPTEYLKKGRGRIEKTEIIEMAIKHMKFLQDQGTPNEQYRLGYQECMSETMRFMVEVEGHFSHEAVCVRLLNHLQKHCASLSRGPSGAVLQTVPTTDHHLVSHSQPHMNDTIPAQVPEFKKAKTEIEPNNNNILINGSYVTNSVTYPIIPQSEEFDTDQFEKNSEAAAASYKYKNNIKMRFNQDLNSCNSVKRLKLENGRRNSITSIENQSSSHSSPPSSELCTRISEVEHMNRNSPTDSTLSMNNQLKVEAVSRNDGLHRFTPSKTSLHNLDVKSNFSVPIFALHAKGSYYIPLTIDYKTLLPYLHNYDILEALPAIHNIVLHPVTINVNFQSRFVNNLDKYKCEYSTSSSWN